MKILAIESSCDETAAAVVCDDKNPQKRIFSNVISSQIELHAKYGGVVPEYAARQHLDAIDGVVNKALATANVSLDDVDAIAATAGPGLIGGLLVGTVAAKTIAFMKNKPFIGINHLEGHLLTVRLCYDVEFPFLLLLASGGHFIFAEILEVGKYKILGETLDDAAGEAFDKVAKMLGFEYPGGPSIEKYAKLGDKNRFKYALPMQRRPGCDASFSGIKTATKIHIESIPGMSNKDKCDVAASFQNIIVRSITRQIEKAYEAMHSNPKNVVLAGGVAANLALREAISNFAKKNGLTFFVPPVKLCSDNAAMIGWCAIERLKAGYSYSSLDFKTIPRWPINKIA
ncbi:MAG: tRNA (adenosine(37)-N6)-threonylcarbamoyltransferase complex transferase subunit TsaD [Holosporales bacterium]|nr:tRNA (adenosine(37)-N6)-threonylcarbamoyltransferase complex transferase subunit TsaD [Holosporales bacterium]